MVITASASRSTVLPSMGQLVEALPLVLDGRVHGRHLLDIAA
jgi:hypothetical protein